MIYLTYDVLAKDYELYPENEQPPKPLRLTAESTDSQADNLTNLLTPLFAIQNDTSFDVVLKPYWHAFFGTYNPQTKAFLGFDRARADFVQGVIDDKIKKEGVQLIAQQHDKDNYTDAGVIVFKKDGTGDGTDYFDVLAQFCAKQKSELEQLGFSLCQVSDSEIIFKAAAMVITRPTMALGNYIDFN